MGLTLRSRRISLITRLAFALRICPVWYQLCAIEGAAIAASTVAARVTEHALSTACSSVCVACRYLLSGINCVLRMEAVASS
jgi:hypothetical protein